MDIFISKMLNNKDKHFWFFLSVLLILASYMIYAYNPIGEYPGWDYYFHIMRFEALINALKDGTFPSYIDYNAATGYGYLCKTFYPDPILIPFAAVGLFTGSYIAYQVMIFTLTVLCGIFTYKTINTIYKNTFVAGLGAILYTFSIYRLYDLFHRAALGESISFTFFPLVILGLYYIIKGNYKKWYILSIGFSLIIFSHVISSVLTFVTLLIIALIYFKSLLKEPKRIIYLLVSGIATLLIVSYFLWPMLEQMASNTFYYQTNSNLFPRDTALGLKNIFLGITCGINYGPNAIFVGTGFILTILILLRIFVKSDKSAASRSIDIGVLIGIFYIFCASRFFPWGYFPFSKLNFIQFPWRLYKYTTYFFAVGGAYYIFLIFRSNKKRFFAGSVVVLLTVFTMYTHSNDYRSIQSTHLHDYLKAPAIINGFYLFGAEYVPSKVPSIEYIAKRGSDSITTNYDNTAISNFSRNRGKISFDITASKPESIELPLLYYKGYAANLNGKELEVKESTKGLVQIPVEQSGRVEVFYKGTTIQKVSYYITLVSILILCIYICLQRRKRKNNLIKTV